MFFAEYFIPYICAQIQGKALPFIVAGWLQPPVGIHFKHSSTPQSTSLINFNLFFSIVPIIFGK
jgi:hypothetical protein